jgi:hypothetical protein
MGCKVNSVEAVGDIYLYHVDRSVPRVRGYNLCEESGKGLPELHGFLGGQLDCFLIDEIIGIVHDGSWAPVVLWDHADGADS